MRCRNCGQEIPAEAGFCPECGQPVKEEKRCAVCGSPLEEDAVFCANCGAAVSRGNVCANCGGPLEEGAAFCANCGQPAAGPMPTGRGEEQSFPSTPSASGRSGLLPILIVLAVGVLAAGGLFGVKYLLDQRGKKQAKTEPVQEQQADEEGTFFKAEAEETETPPPTETPMPTETAAPTETPMPVPTEPPHADVITNASAVASLSASYTRIGETQVTSATASSQIYQESGVQNPPIFLFDGDDQTNWQEGVPGDGIGESVSFTFDQEYQVQALSLRLGNWKNEKYFMGNNRPKTLEITMNGQSWELTFPDTWQEFGVAFSAPVATADLSIKILEVYKGTSWEDTPISEVSVWKE